jgi:hypothetical protein
VTVAFLLGGVVADHEAPAGGLVELDLLDPQVVADLLVAALCRRTTSRVGGGTTSRVSRWHAHDLMLGVVFR